MVNITKAWMFILLILVPVFARSSEVQVSSQADQINIYEKQPIKGMITVTHDENIKIDDSSFVMENKPLKVNFVQKTKISPDNPLTITIYRFEIPEKPKGLYVLPEVSVKVGGKVYRSYPSSYEVRAEKPGESPTPSPAPSQPAANVFQELKNAPTIEGSLKLEAIVEGKNPLYPGETLRFIYRFYFSGNIELTREELPLLDAEGFIKIGDKEFKDYTKDHLSVNEIVQFVEAEKPGSFTFGPSIAEGLSNGKTPLRSESPAITVTVKSFPEADKPKSFNGAVGKFTFNVSLKSAEEVNVGDEMTLLATVSGTGNFRTVTVPELCCQPGFSGFFRLSDLPPTNEVRGDAKHFTINLQPLSDSLKEIPSVEFSYFNPAEEKYVVLRSKPIPIVVKPSKPLPVDNLDETKKAPLKQLEESSEPVPVKPEAIEIQSNFKLESGDLYNKTFGTWFSMLIVPLGIALLIYQKTMRDALIKKQKEVKPVTSTELFQKAFQENTATPLFFDSLNKALKLGLVEAKIIPVAAIPTENLPKTGLSGEVRTFLLSIEERRFTGQGNISPAFLRDSAQNLFEKIQKNIPEKNNGN